MKVNLLENCQHCIFGRPIYFIFCIKTESESRTRYSPSICLSLQEINRNVLCLYAQRRGQNTVGHRYVCRSTFYLQLFALLLIHTVVRVPEYNSRHFEFTLVGRNKLFLLAKTFMFEVHAILHLRCSSGVLNFYNVDHSWYNGCVSVLSISVSTILSFLFLIR